MSSLSKSEAKATGCPGHYAAYYLARAPRPAMPTWTREGIEFHEAMCNYARNLKAHESERDKEWIDWYLDWRPLLPGTREMLKQYAETFVLDPRAFWGAEKFLCAGKAFQPIRDVENPGFGRAPADERVMLHGTLDFVEVVGPTIKIKDYKTGYVPSRIDEYEAVHYAILALAHVPEATEVEFTWDFVRVGATKTTTYRREDWAALAQAFYERQARRDGIRSQYDELGGDWRDMPLDPLAGLCPYCNLTCALRAQVMENQWICDPIQTDADLVKAAGILTAVKSATALIDQQVKSYLHRVGKVALPGGGYARMETTFHPVLKLRDTLAMLGVETPSKSPLWDVPLDSLRVGSTEFNAFAKARKRAGLRELAEAASETRPRTMLRIGEFESEVYDK